jgi:hypothetical protein
MQLLQLFLHSHSCHSYPCMHVAVRAIVSPTAVIVYMENIGFVYPAMSMMVIGPSLPMLRQSRWSLLYDVY